MFRSRRTDSTRGQSIVEFALILPLLLFLMVAIIDLARIYTTMLSVESAAREAADYGSFGSQKWADPTVVSTVTEPEMLRRACVASKNLTDYVGDNTTCTNPSFSYDLSVNQGASWNDFNTTDSSGSPCDNDTRNPPCWVRVNLTYTFNLLVPFHIEIFGVQYGLPSSLTFTRTSIFPMTDLTLP